MQNTTVIYVETGKVKKLNLATYTATVEVTACFISEAAEDSSATTFLSSLVGFSGGFVGISGAITSKLDPMCSDMLAGAKPKVQHNSICDTHF